jgi:hypothetical protein
MVCISKQHLKRLLNNEVSKSEKPFTDILHYVFLELRSSQLAFNVKPRFSDVSRIECWELSNVSANIAVSILMVRMWMATALLSETLDNFHNAAHTQRPKV